MSIGMKRGTVYLESHQKCWEKSAESVMCDIRSALNGLDAAVEHIGSTAIRSIRAKPIVDIAVAVSDYNAVFARNVALEKAGIIFRLDERPEQLLYVKGDFENDTRTHHIHVVLQDSLEWQNYLNFRDYLNVVPTAAREYEAEKERLASLFPNNRESYVEGKCAIVAKLLKEAQAWRHRQQNEQIPRNEYS